MEEKLKRLKVALAYLNGHGLAISKTTIAADMHSSQPNVSRALMGHPRYFTDGFLRRFARAYKEHISEAWLLTGQGRMDVPGKDERPHVDSVTAAAGRLDGFSEPVTNPDFHRLADLLPDYDFTIRADGDSMLPEIRSGDLLLCRRLDRPLHPADLGRIFVADTADGVLVKRLADVDPSASLVTLRSLNPAYPDIAAPASGLLALARVVAVVHPVGSAGPQKSK